MTLRIRHLAHVNPSTPAFDGLLQTSELTFMPLETVWADERQDTSRIATKSDVCSGYVRFLDGDVLVPKTAPTFQHGRAMVAKNLVNGVGAGSSELHLLRPRLGVDARFLAYVARCSTFIAEGVTNYQGVAGLQRVPADFVAGWPIPAFSSEEQRRIADFLDDQVTRLDAAVKLRHEQTDIMQESVRAAAQRRLTANYPQVPVRRVVRSVRTGTTPSQDQAWVWLKEDDTTGIGWLSPNSFSDESLTLAAPSRRISHSAAHLFPRFSAGSTLVVGIGATAGRVAHLETTCTGNQQLTALEPSETVLPRFLTWSVWARQGALRETAPFTTLPILNNETLRALEITVPSLDDQSAIVQELDERMRQVDEARRFGHRWTGLANERKQALITAAVTGQFDVTTAQVVA
jgi:type I restriction enzyme S subunit